MSFVNAYSTPTPTPLRENDLYGPDPYDINFYFPVHVESLETERVRLTPFIPKVHTDAVWEAISPKVDELFRHYPFVLATREAFLTFVERDARQDKGYVMFVVIDKTLPDVRHPEFGGTVAGLVALRDSSTEQLSSEITFVMIFPKFHRSHVASNAIGVLMKYCLEVPTASPPGLGLRRVLWHCHSGNIGSKRFAERMGFVAEGLLRWHRVLPEALARDGLVGVRKDDPASGKPGRHTWVLSVCWDDWEGGVRDRVQEQIDRKA